MPTFIPVFRFARLVLLLAFALGIGVGLALAGRPGEASTLVSHGETAALPQLAEAAGQAAGQNALLAATYLRAAGSAFIPSKNVDYFSDQGCTYMQSGAPLTDFFYDLQLPHGAVLDSFTLYYLDSSVALTINAYIAIFDATGSATLVSSVASAGFSGYGSATSADFSHIVDNLGQALSVWVRIPAGGVSGLQLCGVRVRYQPPQTAAFMPTILNQATP